MKKLLLAIVMTGIASATGMAGDYWPPKVIAERQNDKLLPMLGLDNKGLGPDPKWVYLGNNVFYDENTITITHLKNIWGGGARMFNIRTRTNYHVFMTGNACKNEPFTLTFFYPNGHQKVIQVHEGDIGENQTLAEAVWWKTHSTCDQNQGSYEDAATNNLASFTWWDQFITDTSVSMK